MFSPLDRQMIRLGGVHRAIRQLEAEPLATPRGHRFQTDTEDLTLHQLRELREGLIDAAITAWQQDLAARRIERDAALDVLRQLGMAGA